MPDIIPFDAAIEATAGEDRALLIGNGFSANYFSYRSLFEKAGIEGNIAVQNLFHALDTVDFETVVRALEDAAVVETAYGNEAHAAELTQHAQQVREALVRAINNTHPEHKGELAFELDSGAKFLAHFATVFSLNYDLLLYWLNLEKVKLRDGFGLGEESADGRFRGPFSENAHCDIFNLHGGLHLFRDSVGEIHKALNTGDGVIATITNAIAESRRLPLYVAEGTSAAKVGKINSVPYLRHCFDSLRQNAAAVFVYGHSAAESDEHVYRAVFGSEARHVYFGVFQLNGDALVELDAQLAKYQKLGNQGVGYTLYDSESAQVWDS